MSEAKDPVPELSRYRQSLEHMQERLTAEIARIRSTLPHSGEIGTGVEEVIRRALAEVLPPKVGVSHGFVIDSHGGESKQMDIVLYDAMSTPHIFVASDVTGHRVFPVEATYACGEVKTELNRRSLKDVFNKCDSYKTLKRSAYLDAEKLSTPSQVLFGEPWRYWQSVFFCLAVDCTDLSSLKETYAQEVHNRKLDIHKRVDNITAISTYPQKHNCLLQGEVERSFEDGTVCPKDDSLSLLPSKSTITLSYRATSPWALFIALLLQCMSRVPSERVNMLMYQDGPAF